jgi:hypothetical protein
MKTRLLTLVALLSCCATAHAQEIEEFPEPFDPYFTLEIATGMAPIHTLFRNAGLSWDEALADQGLDPKSSGSFCPAFSLSAAWHNSLKWEFVLTGGLSWCNYRVIQYDTFGWDPQGKPRYHLDKPLRTYRRSSHYAGALFFQARRFWNPTQKVKLYSAAGAGLYTDGKEFLPVPSFTPIAVRFGTGPLKFFIENTFSPAATGWNFGLGWTF